MFPCVQQSIIISRIFGEIEVPMRCWCRQNALQRWTPIQFVFGGDQAANIIRRQILQNWIQILNSSMQKKTHTKNHQLKLKNNRELNEQIKVLYLRLLVPSIVVKIDCAWHVRPLSNWLRTSAYRSIAHYPADPHWWEWFLVRFATTLVAHDRGRCSVVPSPVAPSHADPMVMPNAATARYSPPIAMASSLSPK